MRDVLLMGGRSYCIVDWKLVLAFIMIRAGSQINAQLNGREITKRSKIV